MAQNFDIDRMDLDILGLLMNDARLSNKEIRRIGAFQLLRAVEGAS
jgi:hypothetical protein